MNYAIMIVAMCAELILAAWFGLVCVVISLMPADDDVAMSWTGTDWALSALFRGVLGIAAGVVFYVVVIAARFIWVRCVNAPVPKMLVTMPAVLGWLVGMTGVVAASVFWFERPLV